jgi:hypothetical protein
MRRDCPPAPAVLGNPSEKCGASGPRCARFAGPGAPNVIPDSVQLMGTIRALDKEHFAWLRRRVGEVLAGTAAVHGCNTSIEWSPTAYPPGEWAWPGLASTGRAASAALARCTTRGLAWGPARRLGHSPARPWMALGPCTQRNALGCFKQPSRLILKAGSSFASTIVPLLHRGQPSLAAQRRPPALLSTALHKSLLLPVHADPAGPAAPAPCAP